MVSLGRPGFILGLRDGDLGSVGTLPSSNLKEDGQVLRWMPIVYLQEKQLTPSPKYLQIKAGQYLHFPCNEEKSDNDLKLPLSE